jgi:hypothetical protein
VTNVGSTGVESANLDYEFGPFGRSFLGKFPTKGTLILFAISFFFALIISGDIFVFLLILSLIKGLVFFLTYFYIEPHFNSKTNSNHKQELRGFPVDVNSTIGDIGRLFSGVGASAKTQIWDLSGQINFDTYFQNRKITEFPNLSEWHSESKIRTWMKISIIWISIFFSLYIVTFLTIGIIIVFDFNSIDLILGFSTIFTFAISIGILLVVIFLEDKFVYLKSLFNLTEKSKLKFGGLIALVSLLDFILVIAYTIIYDSLGSTPQEVEFFVDANSAGDPLILFILFLSICIGAPLVEELIFRGYILDSIRSNHSDTFAIIGSGLLFGFMHWNPIFGFFDLYQVGSTAIGGMLYAWLRLRTGSIWPPILCHFIWNGTIFFFEFII